MVLINVKNYEIVTIVELQLEFEKEKFYFAEQNLTWLISSKQKFIAIGNTLL